MKAPGRWQRAARHWAWATPRAPARAKLPCGRWTRRNCPPGEFAFLVRQAVEVDNARVVVIDSLNGYLNAMPEERFLTAQMHELLAYLGERGVCTIMVVAQHGMIGSNVQSPVDTSYLADCVVLFRFFEHAGQVRRAVSVIKKRSGKHEDTIRELKTGPHGLDLSAPLSNFQGVLAGVPVLLTEKTGRD